MDDQYGAECYCTFHPIDSAAALAELAEEVSFGCKHTGRIYYLLQDIDLSDYAYGEGWKPIGTKLHPFTGILDGRNYTISGLRINRPGENCQGLFGSLIGFVKNLKLKDTIVSGRHFVGGIAGQLRYGIIEGVEAQGKVYGSNMVGGVVGQAENSNITQAQFCGHASGQKNVGGVMGHGWKCHTKNCVSQDAYIRGKMSAGGIAGYNHSGLLDNCYSTGIIIGDTFVGGIAGCLEKSAVWHCSATAAVNGGLTVGGIAGLALNKCIVDQCLTACSIKGDEFVGSIIGQVYTAK